MATSIVHSERRRKVNIIRPGVDFLQANWACSNQHNRFVLNHSLPKCGAQLSQFRHDESRAGELLTQKARWGVKEKSSSSMLSENSNPYRHKNCLHIQDAQKYENGIHIKDIWIRICRCALLSSARSSHSTFVRTWLSLTCRGTSLIVPTRYRLCLACPDCTRRISWIP